MSTKPTAQTNWEALLVKYMGHVIDCESVSFLDDYGIYGYPELTDEEREILRGLEKELLRQHE